MTSKIKSMKLKLTILTLSAVVTLGAQAGNVSSTFTTGDTLTATKMTEIKDAVNDNNTNVGTNTTAIGTNTADIATNTTAIGTNTSGIATNATAIGTNTAQIANLFGGDGSGGDFVVSASVDWSLSSSPSNPYFNNFTIEAGQTLTLPAGTTIRCKGNFTNYGTILINTGATNRGNNYSSAGGTSSGPVSSAHPGDSFASATGGSYHNDSVTTPSAQNSGRGGVAIPRATARFSFSQFRIGGGAGAGAVNGSAGGGGLLKIYCAGSITNSGVIQANGGNGSGGVGAGGGGIVILASSTLVDNTSGSISVTGGNGANGAGSFGNSGGGGGGIIIMVSPTDPILGTNDVSGGTGGTSTSTLSSVGRYGGPGGGASGGNGGSGGSISSTGVLGVAGDGGPGYELTMAVNPAYMIH